VSHFHRYAVRVKGEMSGSPMNIKTDYNKNGKKEQCEDSKANKQVKCRRCGTAFVKATTGVGIVAEEEAAEEEEAKGPLAGGTARALKTLIQELFKSVGGQPFSLDTEEYIVSLSMVFSACHKEIHDFSSFRFFPLDAEECIISLLLKFLGLQ